MCGAASPTFACSKPWNGSRARSSCPDLLEHKAYDDCALPIGFEQTISQPYTVAFMCQEARLTAATRCSKSAPAPGYGAAVLSQLVQAVHTVERIEPLYQAAAERLARLGYDNVRVHLDDGSLGLVREAPFDAIVCTAGAEYLPTAYQDQLADGGRLVIPIGPPAISRCSASPAAATNGTATTSATSASCRW